MTEVKSTRILKKIDGLPVPYTFDEEVFHSGISYKPKPNDVFLASYPKCGTTWVGYIITLLFRQGESQSSPMDTFTATPYIEASGAETVEKMPQPYAIKTHLPFHLIPWSTQAKYVYVIRNPKDCCVSFFHHMKNFQPYEFDGTFDEYFETFLSGEVIYGDYFDHLLGWYKHKDDPNVLFMIYEKIKENPKEAILRIASFLDEEKYAKPLMENEENLLNKVIYHSSLDYMKKKVNSDMEAVFTMSKEEILKSDEISQTMKNMFLKNLQMNEKVSNKKSIQFVRKGVTGDWRNHFSAEQSQRLDEKFKAQTKGTDVAKWWEKYMSYE